jgi:hypothetical protein
MAAFSQDAAPAADRRTRVAERVNTRTTALAARLRRVPTPAWIVLLIAGAVVTALVVLVVATPNNSTTSTQLVALPDGSTASQFVVRYRIDKPSHADVTCAVQALGSGHDVVGSIDDTTPARDDTTRTSTRQVIVPTTERAVSAQITDCRIVGRH